MRLPFTKTVPHVDVDRIAGNHDYTLDIRLTRIVWETEHYHVAALYVLKRKRYANLLMKSAPGPWSVGCMLVPFDPQPAGKRKG